MPSILAFYFLTLPIGKELWIHNWRVLAKLCEANAQTVLGANLLNIAQESECNIDELTPNLVKNAVFYRKIPEDEQWKVPFLMELLSIRSDDILVDNFTNIEFDEIINILCTS